MKLKYTEGCVSTSLTIDDVETIDMEVKDFKTVIKKMIDKIDDVAILQDVWIRIMEMVGEEEEPLYCECCGDTIYTYNWEI